MMVTPLTPVYSHVLRTTDVPGGAILPSLGAWASTMPSLFESPVLICSNR